MRESEYVVNTSAEGMGEENVANTSSGDIGDEYVAINSAEDMGYGNPNNNLTGDVGDESKVGPKYTDPDLFPTDKLISKMGDNMARSEALVNEKPLWTEKTAELEEKDQDEV